MQILKPFGKLVTSWIQPRRQHLLALCYWNPVNLTQQVAIFSLQVTTTRTSTGHHDYFFNCSHSGVIAWFISAQVLHLPDATGIWIGASRPVGRDTITKNHKVPRVTELKFLSIMCNSALSYRNNAWAKGKCKMIKLDSKWCIPLLSAGWTRFIELYFLYVAINPNHHISKSWAWHSLLTQTLAHLFPNSYL